MVMGWFSDQIDSRRKNDEKMLEESLLGMADAILGSRMADSLKSKQAMAQNAIEEILRYHHLKASGISESIHILGKENDIYEQIDNQMQPHGIMHRKVKLNPGWHRDSFGAMLGKKNSGEVIALLPSGICGYHYNDPETGKRVKINSSNESEISEEAVCFYRPFPLKKLSIPSLFKYVLSLLSAGDYVYLGLTSLVATLVGMLLPPLSGFLTGTVLQSGNYELLLAITVFIVCVTVSSTLFASVRSLALARIRTKLDMSIESATMMRILSLPAKFFGNYSSGELSERSEAIGSLCDTLVNSVLSTGIVSLFSLAYISQIFAFAPALVIPSLVFILAEVAFSVVSTLVQIKVTRRQMELSAKESGITFALICGMQKIRLSGSEKRAFSKWAGIYSKKLSYMYNPPLFLKLNSGIVQAISLASNIVLYFMAASTGVTESGYFAFSAAYGVVMGAFSEMAGVALIAAGIKPILDMAKPLLDAVPEAAEGKMNVKRLGGGISINNIDFRYSESSSWIFRDFSLEIKSGDYIAITGETGCGKSTLVRLLLGFETPQRGAIYYDGKDIQDLNLKSLRKKIGTVTQDGGLLNGDIFSNITITAPYLKMDDAWEAAKIAGIADDIEKMPMGMHTVISEGQGGISGGQKQRLMIARAIAPKPKILILDEATSALDNITQLKISQALDELKCTRIVIAHRLSTIKNCSRIVFIADGRIEEDGTYDELIAKNGKFAELVKKQQI